MPRLKALPAQDFAQAVLLDASLKPTLEKYVREMKEHNAKARQKAKFKRQQ